MREPFTVLVGPAAPLLLTNVDTDVIIRIDRLAATDPQSLAPFAFESLRYRADGTEDPAFILNDDRFRGAPILIAGANFGCGSSREPAVSALMGLGIRCIIAPSYGDIFRSNCRQNGLLPIVLDEAEIDALANAAATATPVTVDLPAQLVTAADTMWSFDIAASDKTALIEALDDLDVAMRDADLIADWETDDRGHRPWAWLPATNRLDD